MQMKLPGIKRIRFSTSSGFGGDEVFPPFPRKILDGRWSENEKTHEFLWMPIDTPRISLAPWIYLILGYWFPLRRYEE